MKVAVSIPDALFEEADRVAQAMGKTRSALYAKVLADFLAKRKDDEITEAINAAVDSMDGDDDSAFAIEAGRRTLARSEW
jgi:metal-responsive CopG/Arc/MetJ family transcriptional regulator